MQPDQRQLVLERFVPASIEQGDAERAQAAKLRIALLAVADGAHELLYRDGLLILKAVLLRCQPAAVNKDVCVRCAAAHTLGIPPIYVVSTELEGVQDDRALSCKTGSHNVCLTLANAHQ